MYLTCTIDWIRHAESCSNFYRGHTNDGKYTKNYNDIFIKYQPNLSYIGMQQSILLGNYLEDYDIIVCSATVRSIMTALLAFRKYYNKVIYVVPYISEITKHQSTNYHSLAVPSNILKRLILFIKDWLEHSWINHYDDIGFINGFNLRGPAVDFTLLEKYENDYVDYSNIKRMSKFYNIIVPELYNKIQKKFSKIKICCFIHSNLMRQHFNYPQKILNTQIFREYVDINYKREYFRRGIIYGQPPQSIRNMYYNIEEKNMDVCSIDNVKGFINIPLWNNNYVYNINVTPDLQIFTKDKMYLKYYGFNGNLVG